MNRSLFSITEQEITSPSMVYIASEFLEEIPVSERKGSKFLDAFNHISNFNKSRKFVAGCIWPNGIWSVIYNDKVSPPQTVPPGQLKTAYYSAKNGDVIYPLEGRPRATYSSGRTGE